jgi:hypothetical protein
MSNPRLASIIGRWLTPIPSSSLPPEISWSVNASWAISTGWRG